MWFFVWIIFSIMISDRPKVISFFSKSYVYILYTSVLNMFLQSTLSLFERCYDWWGARWSWFLYQLQLSSLVRCNLWISVRCTVGENRLLWRNSPKWLEYSLKLCDDQECSKSLQIILLPKKGKHYTHFENLKYFQFRSLHKVKIETPETQTTLRWRNTPKCPA